MKKLISVFLAAVTVMSLSVCTLSAPATVLAAGTVSALIFDSADKCAALRFSATEGTYILGDIDNGGSLDAVDVYILRRCIVGSDSKYGYKNFDTVADISRDGRFDAVDVFIMRKTIVGMVPHESVSVYEYVSARCDGQLCAAVLESDRSGEELSALIDLSSVATDARDYAVITYMTPSGKGGNSSAASEMIIGGAGGYTVSINGDGRFHSAVVPLDGISSWQGDEGQMFFFACANEGDRLYIDSVIFCADLESARSEAAKRESAKADCSLIDGVLNGRVPLAAADKYGNTVIRFDSAAKTDKYVTASAASAAVYNEAENSLAVTAVGEDKYITDLGVLIDLGSEGLTCGDFDKITLVYKLPAASRRRSYMSGLHFAAGDDAVSESRHTSEIELIKEDEYNTCTFSLDGLAGWRGALKSLRIDCAARSYLGDTVYIDSIILSKGDSVEFSRDAAIYRRRGEDSLHVSRTWIEYWTFHKNANDFEYVTGSGDSIRMNFRYRSAGALSSASLAARFERAIKSSTGYNVKCSIYRGVGALRNAWGDDVPSAYIYYDLTFGSSTYIVWVKTDIIKDASFVDPLDSDGSDPDPVYNISESWSAEGVSVSDAHPLETSYSSLASHSNHETRLVETPHGTFAVIPMNDNNTSWGQIGVAFTVFKIENDGTYRAVGTYQCANHSSKPNIFYAADGLVYIMVGDAVGNGLSAFTAYFDPAKPNSDGTYDITASRTSLSFPNGSAPGGYGYTQPILDDTNGLFVLMCCGGTREGYFCRFIYDYKTHEWNTYGIETKLSETYRHCYLYGFSDGAGGLYVVGGRDVLLSTLGLSGTVTGANYAWDEVNLFHFPKLYGNQYTMQTVSAADYTQKYASLFPTTSNNARGDTYLSSDGYLHVLTSTRMHRNFHHDTAYWEYWYSVYDVREPGAKPKLLYHRPINFAGEDVCYSARMFESGGGLYIVAMREGENRCEIWKNTTGTYGFELCANRIFDGVQGSGLTTALIVANSRNGSVNDGTVSVMYPTDYGSGKIYMYFTVKIGDRG